MKKLFCGISLIALLVGCTGTPEHKSYVAVGTTGSAIDNSIGVYNDYRKSHPVSNEQLLAVRKAVDVYVKANALADSVTANFKDGIATQAQKDAAVQALLESQAQVSALINSIVSATK